MKKIDTDELRELLELTETAQRIRNCASDNASLKITDDVLSHVAKRVKFIKKASK